MRKKQESTNEAQGQKRRNFTSHTLRGVGDVIQGDVRPHVAARLCLEGHSERCRVRQDDISICPLVTVVSSGCPHQQTGATRSNSVDLVRCRKRHDIIIASFQ